MVSTSRRVEVAARSCRCFVICGLLIGSPSAFGQESIFCTDFECGSYGPWSNGGDGKACVDGTGCLTGHCQNDYCCASGDCCSSETDCSAWATDPVCDDASTCQGSRLEATCSCAACGSQQVADDSACSSGVQALDCGYYLPVYCTGGADQNPPSCPTTCFQDADCTVSAHCDGTCEPDLGAGGSCDEASDCSTGFCTDELCCASGCSGTCEACDISGLLGSCAAVPSGEDPEGECGAVSCAGYYWGWTGDTCYVKANVPAAEATCNGSRACKTTAQECGAQVTKGSSYVTCNATCQDPTAGTCTGTIAGTCMNVNPGNQTCGLGVCQVTVAQCSNGSPVVCTPNSGAATTEICNGLDDNCDGTVDNNSSFADGYEPNDGCASYKTLPGVGSDETKVLSTLTLYGSGDSDYFRINATETDSTCACCDFFCTDEDYDLTVQLTVPAGAGSYTLCSSTSCSFGGGEPCVTVAAGTSNSITFQFDGACGGAADSYSVYVRVQGQSAPGYSCIPYTLSYFFDAGVCH